MRPWAGTSSRVRRYRLCTRAEGNPRTMAWAIHRARQRSLIVHEFGHATQADPTIPPGSLSFPRRNSSSSFSDHPPRTPLLSTLNAPRRDVCSLLLIKMLCRNRRLFPPRCPRLKADWAFHFPGVYFVLSRHWLGSAVETTTQRGSRGFHNQGACCTEEMQCPSWQLFW